MSFNGAGLAGPLLLLVKARPGYFHGFGGIL
jgi:hypothetical protein